MTEAHSGAERAHQIGSGATRAVRAWRALPHERRLAAYAAIGLFLTLFLPWYQRNFFTVIGGKLQPAADSQTAWAVFSWVEAAVLLVAGGVLALLFNRAEGRAFHVPGGDGGVITAAGLWTGLLIIWRVFDKQGATSRGQYATTYGIEWGIFIALAVAAFLFYAGNRIRAAHRLEPPLPGDDREAGVRQAPAGERVARERVAGEPVAREPVAGEPAAPSRAAGPRARGTGDQPARAPRPVPADRDSPTIPWGADPPPAGGGSARRRAPTRSSAPTWESVPVRDPESAATEDLQSAPAQDPENAPTRDLRSAPARNRESPPARAPRPRRPLPPDEQLTIPLEERHEE